MTTINLSYLDVSFPRYRYTIKEIVDEIFSQKLDNDVRNYIKNHIGIENVYKSFDLRKISINGSDYLRPDILLNDMYAKIAKKAFKISKTIPSEISLLIMFNGNQQYVMPAPTLEMVSRLGLNKEVRTQNFQGMACSSFSEALRGAAGHFAIGGKGKVLLLQSQYSTEWYLNIIRRAKKISMKDKKNFFAFIYFAIFSDIVSAAIISNNDKDSLIKIDTETIFSRKDTSRDSYKKAKVELVSDKKHQMMFDFNLSPHLLKQSVGDLSEENISQLKTKFPTDFKNVKSWGFHTAGLSFVDYVREKCNIDKEKAKLTYELMKETGNTGTVSSLQLIKESVEKKVLKKGEIGGIVDFGWEGSDSFLYNVQ